MKKIKGTEKKKDISFVSIIIKLIPLIVAACPVFFTMCCLIGIVHGISFGIVTFASQLFFDTVSDAIAKKSGISTVMWMAAALGAATIGSQVLNGVYNFMGRTLSKKIEGSLSVRINLKALKIDPVLYESPITLDDINKANEGMNNSLGLVLTLVMLFTLYLPYFLFMGGYLFHIKPILALSIVLIFIPVAITQLIRGAVFTRLADASAPIRREYEYYERCICDREYFKETRILGAFKFFRDLYSSSLLLLGRKVWDAEFKIGLMELSMKMITLAGYIGILYLLFTALLSGEISIGAFAAIFGSIDMMFSIMEEIICGHIGNMTKNIGTVRNFIRFLDMPERKGKDIVVNAGNGIVLKNVSFHYPGAKFDSLSEISLNVKKGETIAIVGENGSGKTTLVKLMMGIYLPTQGSVKAGGVDTKEVSASSVYKGISAVFQKFQKYSMTLGENIKISDMYPYDAENRESMTNEKRLKNAILKADLDTDSNTFHQGFNTMLSREFDGVDISGGQWQRVAIARGFYRTHGMIVLDEPTAAIDPIEETKIFQKFAEISKGKTSIIVTHRLGSAKIANRIFVMDRGKIVAIGTHDELINAGGKYSEMFNTQAQWYVS